MVPTLSTTLGVQGHRPVVPTRDDKDLLYVYASVNCTEGQLHTRTLERPQPKVHHPSARGPSKNRLMQGAFAQHLRDLARAYPGATCPRVVVVLANAPWHGGAPIREAWAEHPHLELYHLPSYSPQLNVIERFWKLWRQQVTHHRWFADLAELQAAVRRRLRAYRRTPRRLRRLIAHCYAEATVSGGT